MTGENSTLILTEENRGTHESIIRNNQSGEVRFHAANNKVDGHRDCRFERFKNAIWFIVDGETHFCSMDETLATEPFLLVEKAHEKLVKGFPLDSLSIDIATGKYYYNMEEKSVDQSAIEMGFKDFFSKAFSELDLNKKDK